MVQKAIRAEDHFKLHTEVAEGAITLLTDCERDVVDIRKRVGQTSRIRETRTISLKL